MLLCEDDAATCAVSGEACACDGGVVPYLFVGYAGVPTSGPAPCVAAATGDAGEGGAP